jgi:hypothetical protein
MWFKNICLCLLVISASCFLPSDIFGKWKLAKTTSSLIQTDNAELTILPSFDDSLCNVSFTVYKNILSTSVSKRLKGNLKRKKILKPTLLSLKWSEGHHTDISICGIGINVDKLYIISDKPRGNTKKIRFDLLNNNVLKVWYEDDVFLFCRSQQDYQTILLPIEMWFMTQLLSEAYKQHVHLRL